MEARRPRRRHELPLVGPAGESLSLLEEKVTARMTIDQPEFIESLLANRHTPMDKSQFENFRLVSFDCRQMKQVLDAARPLQRDDLQRKTFSLILPSAYLTTLAFPPHEQVLSKEIRPRLVGGRLDSYVDSLKAMLTQEEKGLHGEISCTGAYLMQLMDEVPPEVFLQLQTAERMTRRLLMIEHAVALRKENKDTLSKTLNSPTVLAYLGLGESFSLTTRSLLK